MAPPSQKYRQIGFWLEGGGPLVQLNLNIRPEDLTNAETGRVSVQQTLGGAFADIFGRGIGNISIAGHTGWRGGFLGSGEDAFMSLRMTVFKGFFDRVEAAVKAGTDPGTIKLYMMDSLNYFRGSVVPKSFVLRRSRTSPLLYRYQISLVVLDDTDAPDDPIDDIIEALSNPLRWLGAVTGLGNVVGQIQYYASGAVAILGAAGALVANFISTGVSLLQAVTSVGQTLQGQFDAATSPLLSLGSTFSRAAANAFYVLAADPGLTPAELIPLAALASNFNDAACSMDNGFNSGKFVTTFEALFGAGTCSSTGGGNPASPFTTGFLNPFDSMFPAAAVPPVSVTAGASTALNSLLADPIPLIGNTAAVVSQMAAISAGVTVS